MATMIEVRSRDILGETVLEVYRDGEALEFGEGAAQILVRKCKAHGDTLHLQGYVEGGHSSFGICVKCVHDIEEAVGVRGQNVEMRRSILVKLRGSQEELVEMHAEPRFGRIATVNILLKRVAPEADIQFLAALYCWIVTFQGEAPDLSVLSDLVEIIEDDVAYALNQVARDTAEATKPFDDAEVWSQAKQAIVVEQKP